MPLTFLNPALLLGLMAASIPLIIHFLNRRRRRIAFSDLRFLQAAEIRQARRRGIQRWLLLLLRMLIICCLALAAARPHWGGLPGGGGRAVLFVLDASASMQAQQPDGGTRFEAAVALAGAMAADLGAEASVHALLAGAAPRPLFAAWLPAGPAAQAALAGAAAHDGPSDLAGALREATRLVRRAPAYPAEVVLLSDLQDVPHPGLEEAAAELAAAGARFLIRRVSDGERDEEPGGQSHAENAGRPGRIADGVPGGAILAIELPERALRPGEVIEVKAVVRPERAEQPFWIELDGRRLAQAAAPAHVPHGAAVTISFPLVVPAAGLHLGRVGKDPDRLPVDDTRPFVLSVPERLNVLLVHGADRDALGRGGWRYLAQALDPGGLGEGLLRVRSVQADSMASGDLAGIDLLVMVDAGALGRRLGGVLRDWISDGGALLLVAGDPTLDADLRERILPILEMPRQLQWRTRSADQAERARVVDAGHPVLAGLGDEALQTLASARWRRYFAVSEGEARVILASDAGAPLLVEGELGRGRWAFLPFHLRREATDLMLNPLFVPLMQRLATRLVWAEGRTAGIEVGQPPVLQLSPRELRLRPGSGLAGRIEVLVPPQGRALPAALTWESAVPLLVAPPSERAGFHVFRVEGDTLGVVAAVVPPEESEPAVLVPSALSDRLRAAGLGRVVDLGESGAPGLGRALAGRDLARWLLSAALLLMLVELWYGRRVRSAARPA